MSLKEDLEEFSSSTFSTQWDERTSKNVPDPADIRLSNDAVELTEATVLYTDLSGSTQLVDTEIWYVAGEIYKTFLYCAAKLIRSNGGTITSYDGDRVMGIFVDGTHTSNAAKCALGITYAMEHILKPAFQSQYPDLGTNIGHTTGIDCSKLMAARTGVRGDNDLVWIGRAANYAAKLTEVKSDYNTLITYEAYSRLNKVSKFTDSVNMWEKRKWEEHDSSTIYGSNWYWEF